MISVELINDLHCPYCGSRLEVERWVIGNEFENGIVRCGCYRYAVIDGVLMLKQESAPADSVDQKVRWLESGDIDRARAHALRSAHGAGPGASRLQRIATRVLKRTLPTVHDRREAALRQRRATFLQLALHETRSELYAQYLYHRYANVSFLASIAPLMLLRELERWRSAERRQSRVLELTCGVGHSAFLIRTLFPSLPLIATDHDFANLYVARRFMAPDATFICIDSEVPLPFRDDYFDGVFCLDGFHYIRSKVALVRDLVRVLDPAGVWLFPHLHNALTENFAPGIPLSPEGYIRCFQPISFRLYDEAKALRDFAERGVLDLSGASSPSTARTSQNLLGIGASHDRLWRRHENLMDGWFQAKSPLTLNPIFRAEKRGRMLHLTAAWPSERLEAECRPVMEYLPRSLNVDAGLVERARTSSIGQDDLSKVRELIQAFVLVRLPEGYARSAA